MKKKNKAQYYQSAGIFYAILAVSTLSNMMNSRMLSVILVLIGDLLIALPLISKKKSTLPVIGFALLAASSLYSVITYSTTYNIILGLLGIVAAGLMCCVFSSAKKAPAARKAAIAKLRILPPVLTVAQGVLQLVFYPIMYRSYPSIAFQTMLWAVVEALAMYYAATGLMHLDDAPAEASASTTPDAVAPEDSASEELKAYKSLLDNGIISQEEYNAKRDELFGK